MSKTSTAKSATDKVAPTQLNERDLDQVSGGLLPQVAPQPIAAPRDPGLALGGPKMGLPLI